jgi:glycosyltransferase involved in cell wall biosynthesis
MLDSKNILINNAAQKPLVSVVIPSYNQGMYIEKAINSVLSQDFKDFELLISDDDSPDNSWDIIQRYNDPRIRIFQQQKNLGPVGNLVFLIKETSGKYVALLNSDDYWLPGKLGKQVEIMELDPKLGACFTWADLVDETGEAATGVDAQWGDVFKQPNRTQAEWLNHFFFHGNCICHPSVLIRRDVYNRLGFYNPALRQLPDFDMWIRLVRQYPIHIIQEKLVGHLRTGGNTSAVNHENTARNMNELLEIFYDFFKEISDEMFVAGFDTHFRLKDVSMSRERLHCEKLFLLLDSGFVQHVTRAVAIRGFYEGLRDTKLEQTLLNDYGFSVFNYYQLTGTAGLGSVWLLAMNQVKPKLSEIWQATKHHWQENPVYILTKKIARQVGLIPRLK